MSQSPTYRTPLSQARGLGSAKHGVGHWISERVAAAKPFETESVSFRHGGFEIPTEQKPDIIRAFNVLRQYDESEVAAAWAPYCSVATWYIWRSLDPLPVEY